MRSSLKVARDKALRLIGATAASGATVIAVWSGVAFAAGTGYGPAGTGTLTAPTGFTNVVTSQTVPTTGGTVAASYSGGQLSVEVPAGDFSGPAQVSVTAPTTTSVSGQILAFAISFTVNGVPATGTLAHPITFTVTNPSIKAGDVIEVWNGSAWSAYPNATVVNGSATITITSDPAFAIASGSPAVSTSGVAGATSPSTGVPVLGLGAIAVGAVAVGGAGLLAVRRRRARA